MSSEGEPSKSCNGPHMPSFSRSIVGDAFNKIVIPDTGARTHALTIRIIDVLNELVREERWGAENEKKILSDIRIERK